MKSPQDDEFTWFYSNCCLLSTFSAAETEPYYFILFATFYSWRVINISFFCATNAFWYILRFQNIDPKET